MLFIYRVLYPVAIFLFLSSSVIIGQTIISPSSPIDCDITTYSEYFESGIPTGWSAGINGFGTNNILDEGWYHSSSTTPTPNTGPIAASQGKGYLYYEVSGIEKPFSRDTLKSPDISLIGSTHQLLVDLLLYGDDVQTLQIDVVGSNSGRTTLALYTGIANNHNSPTDWQTALIDLSNLRGENIYLEFIGTKNGSPLADGDIAIDNLLICTQHTPMETVPTLSEWSIIILFLSFSIVGICGIKPILSPKLTT